MIYWLATLLQHQLEIYLHLSFWYTIYMPCYVKCVHIMFHLKLQAKDHISASV